MTVLATEKSATERSPSGTKTLAEETDSSQKNVPTTSDVLAGLEIEFARFAALVQIAQHHRENKKAGTQLTKQVAAAQQQVDLLRATGFWNKVLASSEIAPAFDASAAFVADVFVASLYPLLRPASAFALQTLHNTTGSFMSQALLHEVLFLRPEEEATVNALLMPVSPLVQRNFIRLEGSGPLRRVHAGPPLLRCVLREEYVGDLPAGIRLVDHNDRTLPALFVSDKTQTHLDEVVSLAQHFDATAKTNSSILPGGPAILFVGAPGTGKSLAARHIARRLQRPLFQLDLGGIVSKWVGETERNLSRVFEQMSGTNGAILIDEADAILGKRVSVKEGRDHYVNITVSHLLTLLENHRGVVILTSNLRGNLDDAYTRRFAAVVPFKRPDEALRQKLWERTLQLSTNIHKRRKNRRDEKKFVTHLAELSASVDLSAAEITNACHLALALAAQDDQRLAEKHIAAAVWREKTKTTLTFTKNDLRELSPYAEEIA